ARRAVGRPQTTQVLGRPRRARHGQDPGLAGEPYRLVVLGPERPGLLAVAAHLHRAPRARAVARLVVEGDAAMVVAARLQARPLGRRRQLGDRRDDAADRAARVLALGRQRGAAVD